MRILIADDNQRVRAAVAELLSLQSGCEVCGEAQDGPETIRKAVQLAPDVVFLDISMPGMDGLAVTRRLRTQVPSARIVVMSQHDPDILLPVAMAAGADGCLDKNRLKQEILSTLERVTSAIRKDAGPDLSLPRSA